MSSNYSTKGKNQTGVHGARTPSPQHHASAARPLVRHAASSPKPHTPARANSPFSLKNLFRNKSTSQHPSLQKLAISSPKLQRSISFHDPNSNLPHKHNDFLHHDTDSADRTNPKHDLSMSPNIDRNISRSRRVPVSHSALRKNVPGVGTRGLFLPAYSTPRFFTQLDRAQNPVASVPVSSHQLRGAKPDNLNVVVQFYHCENLCFSRSFKLSPRTSDLASMAIAFLGDCELRNSTVEVKRPNPGYTGLNLEWKHGGYHLHYPDCAGTEIFSANMEDDWEEVMRVHSYLFPRNVLLIGVGLGEANDRCVEK
ncbi:hypothetical protein F4779DRAFT_576445 [Xylariaceae sp. FL0662B]|nr:hypothetical protein F4779DRAFT_576445 [Xylariaceae sp. FL0662B]